MNESLNKNMPSATIMIPERRGAPSPGRLSPVPPSDDASPRPRSQGGAPAQKPAGGDQPKRVMRRGDSSLLPTGVPPTSRPALGARTSSDDSAIAGEYVTSPAGIDEQESEDFTLDAFLLAAMKKHQDRMLLLKLDKELEHFINDKSRTRLDLPTMNAYHRLIAHKAAEYFKLDHSYDHDKKSVYMCKCPATEIPAVRFTDLIESDDEDVQEKPKVITIMKRRSPKSHSRGLGNELNEKGEIDRSKMSLGERQVLYEEARKRIFNDQDETNRGSTSSSPTMRPAESSGQGSPTASINGEVDTIKGSKGQLPKGSGPKKSQQSQQSQQGRQNSGGSNGGNGNTIKPPLNRNGSGGPSNGPINNAQKQRPYAQVPSPFDRGQFSPQNYGPRPGASIPGLTTMGAPPPNPPYFNQSMGFEATTVTPFNFGHEGVPSNQLYSGIPPSQPDWSSGIAMYGPSPSHLSRDTWGSNPADNGKNAPYYPRPPPSQPNYAPPQPQRPPSFLGQRPPYMYGGGIESYKGPMDGPAMQGGQPMMQKPGPGSFNAGNGFDQPQWWSSGSPHGGQWGGFNPNVGAGGGGYGGGIYNGGVAQQGHKPGFNGSAWTNNTNDPSLGGNMFSQNSARHPPPQPTMPQHMMPPDTPANMNCNPGPRRSQNGLQGAGFVNPNQLSQDFGALNLGNNTLISTQQQQQQNYAAGMGNVNLAALNPSTMPPPIQVYDLERRPPPSTDLFDPNGPTPSSSTNSTAGSGPSYAAAAAIGSGTNGSTKGSAGGPTVSLTSAFNPVRRKENLMADPNGSASAASVASGMVRSHSLHLPQPPANQAYQNMNLHRAQTSPVRKKEGTGMATMTTTTIATTAMAATTTTATIATTTTTTTTTTAPVGTGLLFEYPLQTPYDGVKPEDVAASAAVDHILELYDYAEDDVPVDAIFQNARLKHLSPSARTRGRGVILAIFKKAALAREVLDEHQAKESKGPTRFKIRVWEPVKANLSQTASLGSDEGEEGTDIDKADSCIVGLGGNL